jgi:hypothetical protein
MLLLYIYLILLIIIMFNIDLFYVFLFQYDSYTQNILYLFLTKFYIIKILIL